jgi:hypothetical protein
MFVSNDNQVKYLEVVETIRIPYCNTCHMMQGHCFLGSVPGRVLQKLCAGTPMSFSHVPSISQALGWWQSCESLDGDFSRPISKVGIQVGNPKPVGWALHFWILLDTFGGEISHLTGFCWSNPHLQSLVEEWC